MNIKKFMPNLVYIIFFIIILSIGAGTTRADTGISSPNGSNGTSGSTDSPYPIIWYPTQGRFTFENGFANGSFLSFGINGNTGEITDYTLRLTFYPIYYSPMPLIDSKSYTFSNYASSGYTQGSLVVFSSIGVLGFEPAAQPNVFANYLVLQGERSLLKITDQEGGNIHCAASTMNITVVFMASDGLEITLDSYSYNYSDPEPIKDVVPSTNSTGGVTNSSGSVGSPGIGDVGPSAWHTLWIRSNDTVTTMSIYDGTVSIAGQRVEVTLSAYGYLDVYTYVEYKAPQQVNDYWYNDLNIQLDKSIIEGAKDNGTITAEGWCTNTPTQTSIPQLNNQDMANSAGASNYYTYNDPTFTMNFTNIDRSGIDVLVNSQVQEGRIIIINVDKTVLQTTSIEQLALSIDSAAISHTSNLEALMQMTEGKSTQGAYYAIEGESLITVFVYVPHFSTHTISIRVPSSSSAALGPNLLMPLALSLLVVVASIGCIVYQRRKYSGEI